MALRLLPLPAAVRPSLLRPLPQAPTRGASATALRARAGVAFSLQTNVRLLKPNRRVRRSRDPYYDFDEEDDEFEEEDDDEGYETDVLSLSLEENLKPKYLYLVNDLKNKVQSLTKYPMYLSLSLDQRIRPRHRFLVSLKKAPKGPFPLSSFVPTDEHFCQRWAGTSLEKYHTFKQSLLLTGFAEKSARKTLTSRW